MRKQNCNKGKKVKSNLLIGPEGLCFLYSVFVSALNWIMQCTFSLLIFKISARYFIVISTHELCSNMTGATHSYLCFTRRQRNEKPQLQLEIFFFCPAHNLSKLYLWDLLCTVIRTCAQKVQEQNGWTEEEGQAHRNVAPPFASGMGEDTALKVFQGTYSHCICFLPLLSPFPC